MLKEILKKVSLAYFHLIINLSIAVIGQVNQEQPKVYIYHIVSVCHSISHMTVQCTNSSQIMNNMIPQLVYVIQNLQFVTTPLLCYPPSYMYPSLLDLVVLLLVLKFLRGLIMMTFYFCCHLYLHHLLGNEDLQQIMLKSEFFTSMGSSR